MRSPTARSRSRAAYRAGNPPKIAGVGQAISDKIAELARTGHLAFYDRLVAEVPPSLVELLRIPGVGPRTVRILNEELGIETLEDLRQAAEAGRLRTVKGLSEKTEQSILEGIAALEARETRMLLGAAEELVETLIAELRDTPGPRLDRAGRVVPPPARDDRRPRPARRDERSGRARRAVHGLASVDKVLGSGSHKAAVRLLRGPQVDLMIMPPGAAGTYLIHFTGSKDHNVKLRGRARDRGWSLSEKGFLRIGEDGEPLTGARPSCGRSRPRPRRTRSSTSPFIEPELREDRGEVEAAATGTLPRLIDLADLRGDLHSHSDWSDGVHTIEQMAEGGPRPRPRLPGPDRPQPVARDRPRPDPGPGRAPAGDHRPAQRPVRRRRGGRDAPRRRRRRRGSACSTAASSRSGRTAASTTRTTSSPGSTSSSRRSTSGGASRARQLTDRVLTAIRSPHVDVIAHPAGRMIQGRDDLDLDWESVYAEAARTGTVLEMNGSDHRLDLSDERARRALDAGCLLSLDSDAHRTEELHDLDWAVAQARRAWVTPERVLNTRSRSDLLAWVAGKADRIAGV